jgi:flagellar basal body-associated protein FliL
MALNPAIMRAVEDLNYRVTVGDVASRAGLDIKLAEQGVLALASDAGGHLQVAESGEIAYLFPKNFRTILRNKFWRVRLQDWWNRIWNTLFYLIRISFGILLIVSIVVIFVTIAIIMISLNSRQGDRDRDGGFSGGGFIFLPRLFFGPDLFWFFSPDYHRYRHYRTQTPQRSRRRGGDDSEMNFLEAVFSFLFGDGNPNADLEEKRWRAIATVIRNNGGAVVAEQIAPYLDDVGQGYEQEYEDYMLPVLTRFSGRPEVSPNGDIIYHFPALQVMAEKQGQQSVASYLKEATWKFSNASSGQLTLAAGLGGVNIVGAAILGVFLQDLRAEGLVSQLGGWVGFVDGIYWLLLAYGIGFLAVPLVRYLWIHRRNRRIEARNEERQARAAMLNAAADELQPKIDYAHQFAAETVITEADLAYTTEKDLMLQEAEQSDKIDAEWQQRLRQSGSR